MNRTIFHIAVVAAVAGFSATAGARDLRIMAQPANVTVTAPHRAGFKVLAAGKDLNYRWQKKARGALGYSAIIGAVKPFYTTPATSAADDGASYECVVSNASGVITSRAALLKVKGVITPALVPTPLITSPANNSSFTAGSTITLTATAGANTTVSFYNGNALIGISPSTSSPYFFTWSKVPAGSYSLIAKAADTSFASPAIAITVTQAAPPTVSIIPPMYFTAYTAPAVLAFEAQATAANGAAITKVDYYSGTSLIGTAAASPYEFSWSNVPAGNYSITAVATDSNGLSAGSDPFNVSVLAPSAPVVSITSPSDGSSLTASAVLITVNASETQVGMMYVGLSSVSFYNGTTLLGSSTEPPYNFVMNHVAAGTYTVTAKATDTNGVSTTSSPVTFTVSTPPFSVSIASPLDQSTLTTGSLNITALVSDGGAGGISKVAFYNGGALLGNVTGTSSAFTYTWTNIPAGTHSLTAVATDNNGTSETSLPVSVSINPVPFTTSMDDNLKSRTDALGHTTNFQYDQLNRLVQVTFADQSSVSYKYDLFGDLTVLTDQRNNKLTKTYDAYDRLSQIQDANNGLTQFNYDTAGRLLTLTDANQNKTAFTYDPNNRVLTQTNALNFTITYSYDPAGNVSTRQDGNGMTTNYTYDNLNRLTKMAYPDGTSVAYGYDILSRRTSMTDATGQTGFTYDALNRILTKTDPGANSVMTYTYDGEGNRLTSVDQNNRTVTNTYDALNRLSTVTDQNGTTSYGYDAVSNRNQIIYPNGVQENDGYDALNRITSAVNATHAAIISSVYTQYDQAGMAVKRTFQDGSTVVYGYDALNQLLSEVATNGDSTIYNYAYTYDAAGNRLTWTKNTTLGSFWSNDAPNISPQVLTNMTAAGFGQGVNPTQPMSTVRTYHNDAGNRLNVWTMDVDVLGSVFESEADAYTYDHNGNRTIKEKVVMGETATPQKTTYGYDFENRLISLSYQNLPGIAGNQTDNLVYNGDGQRMQAVLNGVVNNYLYDGFNMVGERDGLGNAVKSYTRGLDIGGGIGSLIAQNSTVNNAPVVQYYQYNDLGSVSNLTNPAGAAVSSYSYDAYGNLTSPQASGDGNRYLFSTKEFDSRGGLDYFGGRYYDPEIGRWLTQDPAGMIDGVNMYAYAVNNPVNLIDTNGLYVGVAQHHVAGPYNHEYIIIIPDDQSAYANNPLFYKNAQGQWQTTISGGPEGSFPDFGHLITEPPSYDQNSPQLDLTQIQPPCGERDTQFINNLLRIQTEYSDNLSYWPTPSPDDSYFNSNSYIYTILKKAGVSNPNLSGSRPGGDKSFPL